MEELEQKKPVRGRMAIVKTTSLPYGEQNLSVNTYGFRKTFSNPITAAKAIGCDPDLMMDKLSRNRDGMVFVFTDGKDVAYV